MSAIATRAEVISAPEKASGRGWLELFIAVQYCSTAVLLIPGTQPIRIFVRAFPYVMSLMMLYLISNTSKGRRRMPPGGMLLTLALVILAVNLLHPSTDLSAGVAQVVFQLSIAAPLYWSSRLRLNQSRLDWLLWLIFASNAASAVLGLLQVYYPDTFMPPEFSAQALAMNPEIVSSLSYRSTTGQLITRPPGLTDMPGGAAVGAVITAMLGLTFGSQAGLPWYKRVAYFGLAGVALVTLYFTQVRSLLLMAAGAVLVMSVLLLKQRRVVQAMTLAVMMSVLLVGGFAWATAFGGSDIYDRFIVITEEGMVLSFQENRGIFIKHTLDELLFEYPMGAGLGRWGMMRANFGSLDNPNESIWVEIQMTGWLLDGGVLMWFTYGGAILLSLLFVYKQAVLFDSRLAYSALTIFSLNVIVVGLAFSGPAFNTQLGIQYWFLTGLLFATAKSARSPALHLK
ncbi:MAG TPA: hypothetical protein VF297_05985 [Pyrinomonadaceae bacterium]